MNNGPWILVDRPYDKRIVGCKWVFRKNEGISGVEETKYKARMVANEFTQVEGVDFNEIHSTVVKHYWIRTLLVMVAFHDLELEQLDVKTDFLHGDMEETIYMCQPDGDEKNVCHLKNLSMGWSRARDNST